MSVKVHLVVSLLCFVVGYSQAVVFTIRNNLPGPIWVGILGNGGKPALAGGGFVLDQNQQRDVTSDDHWAGRFWARTWCSNNHCETGDCGRGVACNGAGGEPPATLVEITLRGSGDQDFYDISLVDGFNVKASISPVNGRGSCRSIGCNKDLNVNCPNDLKKIGAAAHYAIGCLSDCIKYRKDEFCCAGSHNTPSTCGPSNSARYFKANCPDAYSYAYDDATSTFTCRADAYRITFG